MKWILIIYIIAAGTSEQMPEWYDSKSACETAGKAAKNDDIDYACIPVNY